jgi:hypothetical protein
VAGYFSKSLSPATGKSALAKAAHSSKERLLLATDEPEISIVSSERLFSFEGKGADFQLACEARRVDFAFLFAPTMAVHTSNVEPLRGQANCVPFRALKTCAPPLR